DLFRRANLACILPFYAKTLRPLGACYLESSETKGVKPMSFGMDWHSRSLRLINLALLFLVIAPAALAQTNWTQLAPFPEPNEEILGVPAGGKLYVMAGLVSAPIWTPIGLVYEYDPATNHWTKKKPMALPAHHVALTEYHGKIYAFGGFVAPQSGPAAWVPINNSWEYDPATDTWKALAPLPTKRGSPLAAVVNDKIYVIGGATTPPGSKQTSINMMQAQLCLGTVEEYDPATNTWRERTPMPTPRNHAAIGVVNGKIYVIGGRVGAAFIALASDTSVVEEYDPATDKWGPPPRSHAHRAQRARRRRVQRPSLRRRRRVPGSSDDGHIPCCRGVRSGPKRLD